MKKVCVILAIAILGLAPVNASVLSSADITGEKFSGNLMRYANGKIRTEVISMHIQEAPFKCTVVLTFKSENVNVTMTFTGGSCSDAWVSAKRVIDILR